MQTNNINGVVGMLLKAASDSEQLVAALDAEPCGCFECDRGVQPGHFACWQPSPQMLSLERLGLVIRACVDGRWRWFVAHP